LSSFGLEKASSAPHQLCTAEQARAERIREWAIGALDTTAIGSLAEQIDHPFCTGIAFSSNDPWRSAIQEHVGRIEKKIGSAFIATVNLESEILDLVS